MVMQLEFRGAIDFASPEAVFKLLYEDDAFTKFYHKEVNKDANACATPWADVEGCRKREVTFKPKSSDIPSFLQSVLGGNLSPVTEVQECRCVDSTFIIHSELSFAVAWGVTLITAGDTILSPLGMGCAIEIKLTLDFQTWYMQERFEKYAASEAVSAFERWLNLARVFCEKKVGREGEPLSEEIHLHSDAKTLSEGNGLDSDAKTLSEGNALDSDAKTLSEGNGLDSDPRVVEEERVPPMSEVDGHHQIVRPATKSILRDSRQWFLRLWNSATSWGKKELSLKRKKKRLLLRQSWFHLMAWIAFGLGVVASLAFGLVYRSYMKGNR